MYDEMLNKNREASNKLYKKLYSWLHDQNSSTLLNQSIKAEELFRKVGITFNVYGNDKAEERLIPFDLIPRIIEKKEWEFVKSLDQFDSSTSKKVGYFTSYEEPPTLKEGRKPLLDIGLNSILKKLNSRNEPFFLLVEGSQVDWGGHDNDLEYVTNEYIEFDRAIGVALKFVDENPNTLLVVTADHETGGLAITSDKVKNLNSKARFSTKGHSASMVPVFSKGIGSKEFSGIYDNTEIFYKMMLQIK